MMAHDLGNLHSSQQILYFFLRGFYVLFQTSDLVTFGCLERKIHIEEADFLQLC